jgi:hypothetical protein
MLDKARELLKSIEDQDRILVTCPFRKFFGFRCPGCGMTHALVALARGDLRQATRYNPFVVVAVPLLAWGIFDGATRFLVAVKDLRGGGSLKDLLAI